MKFKIRQIGRKSNRDISLAKLLRSPAIMVSGFSTKVLPESPFELCDRIKLLLQEKQAGNSSDIINDKIVAIVNKLLEYKRITRKKVEIVLFSFSN